MILSIYYFKNIFIILLIYLTFFEIFAKPARVIPSVARESELYFKINEIATLSLFS